MHTRHKLTEYSQGKIQAMLWRKGVGDTQQHIGMVTLYIWYVNDKLKNKKIIIFNLLCIFIMY